MGAGDSFFAAFLVTLLKEKDGPKTVSLQESMIEVLLQLADFQDVTSI